MDCASFSSILFEGVRNSFDFRESRFLNLTDSRSEECCRFAGRVSISGALVLSTNVDSPGDVRMMLEVDGDLLRESSILITF